MCNACGFLCCGYDGFSGCGCDHCTCSECWSDDWEDESFDQDEDDFYHDEGRQGLFVCVEVSTPSAAVTHAPATGTDGSAAGPVTRSGMNPENSISAPPPHSQGEA